MTERGSGDGERRSDNHRTVATYSQLDIHEHRPAAAPRRQTIVARSSRGAGRAGGRQRENHTAAASAGVWLMRPR